MFVCVPGTWNRCREMKSQTSLAGCNLVIVDIGAYHESCWIVFFPFGFLSACAPCRSICGMHRANGAATSAHATALTTTMRDAFVKVCLQALV